MEKGIHKFTGLTDKNVRIAPASAAANERELSAGYVRTTNNRMELMAAIAGLEALNRSCEVDLYSDSKYLVDAFNQKWIDGWVKHNWVRPKTGPVKNSDLWKRLLAAMNPHKVTFHWVKGHESNEKNNRCDQQAVAEWKKLK